MQKTNLFDLRDYKLYLNSKLDEDPKSRGNRSALAKSIGCQSAYLSAVLRGTQHFTPEQAEEINRYYVHNDMESEYFSALVDFARAGTSSLINRIEQRMNKILENRFDLSQRLSTSSVLIKEDQMIYYSEWYYSAIHTLVSIDKYKSVQTVASALAVPQSLVATSLDFLVSTGLVIHSKEGLKIGPTRLHLPNNSPLISKHHCNWRLRALQSLEKNDIADLHYSSVVTLSKNDVKQIKETILAFIKESKGIIKDSKEETQYSLGIDFFKTIID